jgi:hypothetical protein
MCTKRRADERAECDGEHTGGEPADARGSGVLAEVPSYRSSDRGMRLEPFAGLGVRRDEVHELVTKDHRETASGARIDRVGFVGFDGCHFPNHYNRFPNYYNVLIAVEEPRSGPVPNLCPEAPIRCNAARA